MLNAARDPFRDGTAIAAAPALIGQVTQLLSRCSAILGELVGVLVAQFIQRELAAPGNFDRTGQRVRMVGE